MKNILYSLLLGLFLFSFMETSAQTKTNGFITDFEQSKKEAASLNKPIFAFFTGSEWCYWCKKLQEEVLATPEFKNYAQENYVLFVADFPKRGSLDDKWNVQNQQLADKYGVVGFPTVFLMDATGKVKVQSGYRPGGAENYIKELNDALAEGKSLSSPDAIVACGYTANQRIDYPSVAPIPTRMFYELEEYLDKSGIEKSLLTLIRARVSQINGCAYCLDGHTKEAEGYGIDVQRINLLPVWREAPFYSDRERAALAWAEALTNLPENQVEDELYSKVKKYFTEKELVDLTYTIISINSWNRLAISMRSPVGEEW